MIAFLISEYTQLFITRFCPVLKIESLEILELSKPPPTTKDQDTAQCRRAKFVGREILEAREKRVII